MRRVLVPTLLLAAGLIVLLAMRRPSDPRTAEPLLTLNESMIAGYYTNVDITDATAMFGAIFRRLPREATVYPSEGYYYFKACIRGFDVTGCFTFFPRDRERGILSFSYGLRRDPEARAEVCNLDGGCVDLDASDGVSMREIRPFVYRVKYEDKVVDFTIHHGPLDRPAPASLADDEVYVGPSFDESGLRFHLIFNRTIGRLFWVLNENGFVPESLVAHGPHVAIGTRTGFAFFQDAARERQILIGVRGRDVLHNTWYDGPFDQMPDNWVISGDVELRPYLEKHYGFAPGTIDRFGNYVGKAGRRVAVAPYRVYYDRGELDFANAIGRDESADRHESLAKLTEQIYEVPMAYRR